MIVSALACAVFAGVGCAGNAKFRIDDPTKGPNPVQGVVELKAGADPKEVTRLIESQFGSGYTIEPMPGTQGSVVQGSAFNPNAAVPGNAPAANTAPTYYQYSKYTPAGGTPAGGTPAGLPRAPMDGGIQQTGFQQRPGMAPTAGMGSVGTTNVGTQKPAMPWGQQ
jgi:hypothetical protein